MNLKKSLLATALLSACAGSGNSGEHLGDAGVATSIPAAILGEAAPPRGSAIQYFSSDSQAVGYLAVPEGEGPFPALILIHEWNGLVDRVRQVADALADEGYVALAADLYHGQIGSNRDENIALMTAAREDMEVVISNLDAAQAYLRAREDVEQKIGVMGWCFGGGIALSYGLGGEQHEATAIFYGSLIENPAVLAALDHPVYGTFAELDRGIPPDQVARFQAIMDSLGIENDIHVYDHVDHGFWLRVGQARQLREAPAADAWERLKNFLMRALS